MGKKSIVVPAFLVTFLISTNFFKGDTKEMFSSFIGGILLIIVALLVAILSEEKTKALEEEKQFKLKTAHYFFNPICIAEGFIELAIEESPQEIKEKLKIAQNAVQRIKKVVRNVIEKGEIKE